MELPRIDLTPLRTGEGVSELGREVRAACESLGFFVATGHGLDRDLRERTFAALERFFDQPDAVKERVKFGTGIDNRGYDGIAQQQLDQTAPPDWNEAYVIAGELAPDHPLVRAGLPMHGPNVWPEGLPGWREDIEAFYAAARQVSPMLLDAVAVSLDLPLGHFSQFLDEPVATLRMLHYPMAGPDSPPDQLGAGAHTDWGAVSFVVQRGEPGLQVRLPDDAWLDVEPDPDAVVVNLGDMMQRWTNDRYQSTMHRVRSPRDGSRYSMAFFMDLDYDATVECLAPCHDAANPPRYEPTTAGAHLMAKYRSAMAAAGL